MTRTVTAALGRLGRVRRDALRAECAPLAELDDVELGARLLADTPTHEHRDPALLRHWAETATGFGTRLRSRCAAAEPRVVERPGGIDRLLLARYVSRPTPTVELFTDTLALGEELVDLLGWRDWYAEGALRATALAHEDAHRLLHGDAALRRALRERLGHTALRVGRFRITGHVAGSEELAAHGYAAARTGLGRSPLLLTAALASAIRALVRN
ncbi:hypothetical protein B0I33_11033 [Prauserella shujinwangii]|uniref:Uncharacterized protein n=1 Tax=Prauserella shujinwangii TaxID=1453103 RepID=A0A2T0LNX5_9PSEU|nr:hypothetical protein [Prauserella shujinwangii]PRX44935.1 hypothetical protein B0I33_11033 [Prauserella shujinwangii]